MIVLGLLIVAPGFMCLIQGQLGAALLAWALSVLFLLPKNAGK